MMQYADTDVGQIGYQSQAKQPSATVGTEADRALKEATECSQLASEISMRLFGPQPVRLGEAGSTSNQEPSLRDKLRSAANINGHTADALRHILQSL